jgi:hypothetical protein
MTEQKAFEHTMLFYNEISSAFNYAAVTFSKFYASHILIIRETSDFISAFNGGLFC